MMTLNYQIEIATSAEKLWQVITEQESYSQWAKVFSPDSKMDGRWVEGENLAFYDPNVGGSRAVIDRLEPHKVIEYHHVAIFTPDNVKDIDSDVAKKWIGSREEYEIVSLQESVLLKVTVHTHPDFVSMFNCGWEKALPLIKLISEQAS
ncbi:SRPBCC family protein [Vibrio sp. TRT 21S02]|uniref:SRPBCC family protein n=1 Tax=unclassified Vibrio TaxID=2614977 RepID=UPI003CEC03F6